MNAPESVSRDHPHDLLPWYVAGTLERGETDNAVSGLRTVLRNEPTSQQALKLMARAQTIAGNPELAK